MAYTEHSYSNSNNGGSVNSQDSLWQLKLAQNGAINGADHQLGVGAGVGAGGAGGAGGGTLPDRTYHYDPMTHGGYGGFEDYSHYPPSNGDDYLNQRNNYAVAGNGDPYAAVHKNGKRMDHLGTIRSQSLLWLIYFLTGNMIRMKFQPPSFCRDCREIEKSKNGKTK